MKSLIFEYDVRETYNFVLCNKIIRLVKEIKTRPVDGRVLRSDIVRMTLRRGKVCAVWRTYPVKTS